MSNLKEKTLSSTSLFQGVIVNVKHDDVELCDGQKRSREVVEHPGGVVIVAFTENDEILIVRQWRYPVDQELIELPAGKLERGEDPFEAAKRELEEETGYTAKKWQPMGYIVTTPGFCDEKLYLYKASDLEYTQTNFDEGEILKPSKIKINELKKMIDNGEIIDAKTIVGICKSLTFKEN